MSTLYLPIGDGWSLSPRGCIGNRVLESAEVSDQAQHPLLSAASVLLTFGEDGPAVLSAGALQGGG